MKIIVVGRKISDGSYIFSIWLQYVKIEKKETEWNITYKTRLKVK